MIYNNFKNLKLSALGMGCMRLPTKDNEIDIPAVKEMTKLAIDSGINYFDTAWGYHDGRSETVMGEVLKDFDRNSFYLASKFPGYDLNNMDKVEEIFEAQLKKCQVEYFDFYLFHNVCEANIEGYLDPKFGIHKYLLEQKRLGRIKHLGFSAHGNLETIKRFLDAYGEDMEFCQLQINWLDWNFQNARSKAELVTHRNIPIWVMEPVRGGKLINLEPKHKERLRALRPQDSMAKWAFRFVKSLPAVALTLSGMSNMEQLKENIDIFSETDPISGEEMATLISIGGEMTGKNTLPCTACRYCVAHCPKSLNIPRLIELYNEHIYSEGGFIAPMALSSVDEEKLPSACIGCSACEAVCPQNIEISKMMKDFCSLL